MITRRRTRTRKPRFISLGRELSQPPASSESTNRMVVDADDGAAADREETRREIQLDLFPLHPECEEGKVDGRERDDADANHDGSCYPSSHFFVDPEYGVTVTLTSLLGSTASMDVPSVAVEEREASTLSASPSTPVNLGLARAALRGRERWAFCHDEEDDEGESSSGGMVDVRSGEPRGLLCLKLDYEEVLTAWSDKGPLYVEGEGPPQIVPQLYHHQTLYVDVGGANSNSSSISSSSSMWTVPENTTGSSNVSSREERVMRYREKRQSRMFSKKIRYEVRKVNAEKRPRIKGRFVKTVAEVA